MHLIGTEFLDEIIQTAIITSRLKETSPVSLLLVAESGAGKSKTLLRFHADYIYRCDDLTSKGLFDLLGEDTKNNMSFLLLPDLNPALSHRGSVSNLLMANLLTITADGTMAVADGRNNKILQHRPIGVISAVTTDMFYRNHKRWKMLGLLRRFLAIHYCYSSPTIALALKEIGKDRINANQLTQIHMLNGSYALPKIEENYSLQLESFAKDLATNLSQYISYNVTPEKNNRALKIGFGRPVLPMSPFTVLRTMARAHAALQKREEVSESDMGFIQKLIQFTAMARPAEL